MIFEFNKILGNNFVKNMIDTKQLLDIYIRIRDNKKTMEDGINELYLLSEAITIN